MYGHVHTSFEHNMMMHDKYLMEELYTKQCKMYNVGSMLPYINYTPRTLDSIIYDGELYYRSQLGLDQQICSDIGENDE